MKKTCNCEKEKIKKLITNEVVCNLCQKYMTECEAKYVLNLNKNERHIYLKNSLDKRGEISDLKKAINNLHKALQS